MIVTYEYVHVQISPMLFCFDNTVLLKQSTYRGLVLGRYCDVLSYNFV